MPAPVTDLTTALITGVTAGLVTLIGALPAILGAVVLLVLGWIIAGIVGGLIARGLRAIKVDAMADRAGVTAFLKRAQVRADAAGFIAGIVLPFGLAFGLGGRDEAAQLWRGLRGSVREVAPAETPTPIDRHGNGRPFERSEQSVRT